MIWLQQTLDKISKRVILFQKEIFSNELVSSLNLINLQQMLQDQLFLNQWGVWFCFLGEPNQSKEKYYQNFQLVFTLRSPPDLAYCWSHFGLNTLDNFLVMPNNRQKTYLVKDKWRRINSIQYFKKGIEPKWQDPKNQKGGRFVFSIDRTQENKDLNKYEVYQNLVFYLLGQDFNHSQHINGFRFISPKNNQSFFRVEIWVDFSDVDIDIITHFQTLLTDLFKTLKFVFKPIRFLNNKTQPKEEIKQQK